MAEEYNAKYWNKLQEEWKNISATDADHPWISEFSDYFEPYKVIHICLINIIITK